MNTKNNIVEKIPFDFSAMSTTYDFWYETPVGMANDWVQKANLLQFLSPEKTGSRLLDAGCGTGHWSRFFAKLGYDVVGVDISEEELQQARSYSRKGLQFQKGDICASLPFDTGAFDVVTAVTVIEFVSSPLRALREMARCTRKGGRILIGTLNRHATLNHRRLTEKREPYISGTLYSQEELLQLLRPFGEVRMIGSDPEDYSEDIDSKPLHSMVHPNAPLRIAEIQRS